VGVLLKSIEIFGFKSFADRTTIEFSDGITALLGPNGCGKSNIVDAMKWVLGEQATKSLRAERMEDVIFNGTDERKALNVADVALTLANEGDLFPIDSAEITLRRRLFRDGESEYFVNGQQALLREVRELFYDTGIGRGAYSIMEQGRIDRVLSDKPEERRLLFEEVAGITRHRVRGQEAERKLQRTEENMRQVQSILSEVRRTHDNLKVQSEKTLAYRDLRRQVFEVELDHTLVRLRGFVDERDRRDAQLEAKKKARDKLRARIDSINEHLEENLDQVNKMESELIEHQKRLYAVELEQQKRLTEIRIQRERVGELASKINADQARRDALSDRIETLGEELARTRESIGEHRTRIDDVDANVESFTTRVSHAEERIVANDASIAEHEKSIQDLEERLTALDRSLREITDDIVRAIEEELARSDYSRSRRGELEKRVRDRLSDLDRRIQAAHALLDDVSIGGKPEKIRSAVEKLFGEASRSFGELSEAFESYNGSVPVFLDDLLAPEGTMTRKRQLDEEISGCRETVRRLRDSIVELHAENAGLAAKIREYRTTLEELRLNRVRMSTQVTAMEETVAERERAIQDLTETLEQHEASLDDTEKRRGETEARIAALETEAEELRGQERVLTEEQRALEKAIAERNQSLVKDERGLKKRMEELGATQSQLENLQVSVAETGAEIRNLYENFRDRYSDELSEHEPRMLEITETAAQLRQKLGRLRDRERELGPVNLAAPEEYAEIKQRFDFLSDQLKDLSDARADLDRVTQEIQSESSQLFTEAYEKIKRSFHVVFRRLFGGGRAELKLTEPDNVLESGVEIYAQPPGKKLENIALLSGGERSLTAVALLFATYMVRPSPFCLLDEIDAALDESNVGRFTNMLMEFGDSSQFIVITHNKKTVACAGTLLGVTMEENGVSKVVSIRLGGREELHAV
jgi:chromosome segregation protein